VILVKHYVSATKSKQGCCVTNRNGANKSRQVLFLFFLVNFQLLHQFLQHIVSAGYERLITASFEGEGTKGDEEVGNLGTSSYEFNLDTLVHEIAGSSFMPTTAKCTAVYSYILAFMNANTHSLLGL